jgi:hypothetical protein
MQQQIGSVAHREETLHYQRSRKRFWDLSRWLMAIGIMAVAVGCNLCDSAVLTTANAPTSTNRAYVLETNCGATVDFSRQVTLARGGAVPRPRLTESVINEGTVFRVAGRPDIQIVWNSDTLLTVTYRLAKSSDRIFRKESSWSGISVRFVEQK